MVVLFFFEYCPSSGGIFSFVASVGGVLCVYLFIYYTRLWFCLFWLCWVSGGFSGGPGHIFFLRGAPLCGVSGRYNLFECWPGVGGGAVQVFSSFGLCCGGYGTIEMWEGVVRFFLAFFSLLSVLLAGGCLW
jgi:hypothetical protein